MFLHQIHSLYTLNNVFASNTKTIIEEIRNKAAAARKDSPQENSEELLNYAA